MFLSNNIKLFQKGWELWPVQDFGFREDKYITEKLRVVSLARDIPTGPPFLLIPTKHYWNTSEGMKNMKHTKGYVFVCNPTTKTKSKKGHNSAKILRTVTIIELNEYFTMIYSSANF